MSQVEAETVMVSAERRMAQAIEDFKRATGVYVEAFAYRPQPEVHVRAMEDPVPFGGDRRRSRSGVDRNWAWNIRMNGRMNGGR